MNLSRTATTALAALVIFATGAVVTTVNDSPDAPRPAAATASADTDVPGEPDVWRNRVCNAKFLHQSTPAEVVEWLIAQYDSTPESAKVYVDLVYPTCK